MKLEEFLKKEKITKEDVQELGNSVSRDEVLNYIRANFSEEQRKKIKEFVKDHADNRRLFELYGLNYCDPKERDFTALRAIILWYTRLNLNTDFILGF